LSAAERLAGEIRTRFADPERGGFYYTAADAEQLIARHKELDDNPTPSGQSLAATLLLELGRLRGDEAMEDDAAGALAVAGAYVERAPHALGQTLCALDMLVSPPQEIAIIGPREEAATRELAAAALGGFHPNAVVAYGDGAGEDDLPLLAGKTLVNGRPAV